MNPQDFADIHTHNPDPGRNAVINLPLFADVPEEGCYSIGIHPWESADVDAEKALEWIRRTVSHPRVVAIGECGIDAQHGADTETQQQLFVQQAMIAEEVGKPVIIHAVRSLPLLTALRRQLQPKQRWIVHGFRGKPQTAAQLLRAGFDISIGAHYNPAVPAVVPPDRLFHETD